MVVRSALVGESRMSCGLLRGMSNGLGFVSGWVSLNEKLISSSSTEHLCNNQASSDQKTVNHTRIVCTT